MYFSITCQTLGSKDGLLNDLKDYNLLFEGNLHSQPSSTEVDTLDPQLLDKLVISGDNDQFWFGDESNLLAKIVESSEQQSISAVDNFVKNVLVNQTANTQQVQQQVDLPDTASFQLQSALDSPLSPTTLCSYNDNYPSNVGLNSMLVDEAVEDSERYSTLSGLANFSMQDIIFNPFNQESDVTLTTNKVLVSNLRSETAENLRQWDNFSTISTIQNSLLTPCSFLKPMPSVRIPNDDMPNLTQDACWTFSDSGNLSVQCLMPNPLSLDETHPSDNYLLNYNGDIYNLQVENEQQANAAKQLKYLQNIMTDENETANVENWIKLKATSPFYSIVEGVLAPKLQYFCNECPYKTKVIQHILTHGEKHRNFSCDKCPFVCRGKQLFHTHLKQHNPSNKLICDKCTFTCTHSIVMVNHKKMQHTNFKITKNPKKVADTRINLAGYPVVVNTLAGNDIAIVGEGILPANTKEPSVFDKMGQSADHWELSPIIEYVKQSTSYYFQKSGNIALSFLSEGVDDEDDLNRVKIFHCKECSFKGNTILEIWRHQIIGHAECSLTYTCDECPYASKFKSNIQVHIKSHIRSRKLKCNKCNFSCKYKFRMAKHKKLHMTDYRFKCLNCHYASNFFASIKHHWTRSRHMVVNTKIMYTSEGNQTAHKSLKSHQGGDQRRKVHNSKLSYECQNRNDSNEQESGTEIIFDSIVEKQKANVRYVASNIDKQYSEVLPFYNKVYQCSKYHYFSSNKKITLNHKDTHTKEQKYYSCDKCPFITIHPANIKQHKRNHSGSKNFTCKQCSYTCTYEYQMGKHVKLHFNNSQNYSPNYVTNVAKFHRCKKCYFKAATLEDIQLHQKVHFHDVPTFSCDKCPFVTTRNHYLQMHLQVHLGSTKMKCKQCPFTCAYQFMMREHIKTHQFQHRFKCLNCDFVSDFNLSIRRHMKHGHHVMNCKTGVIVESYAPPYNTTSSSSNVSYSSSTPSSVQYSSQSSTNYSINHLVDDTDDYIEELSNTHNEDLQNCFELSEVQSVEAEPVHNSYSYNSIVNEKILLNTNSSNGRGRNLFSERELDSLFSIMNSDDPDLCTSNLQVGSETVYSIPMQDKMNNNDAVGLASLQHNDTLLQLEHNSSSNNQNQVISNFQQSAEILNLNGSSADLPDQYHNSDSSLCSMDQNGIQPKSAENSINNIIDPEVVKSIVDALLLFTPEPSNYNSASPVAYMLQNKLVNQTVQNNQLLDASTASHSMPPMQVNINVQSHYCNQYHNYAENLSFLNKVPENPSSECNINITQDENDPVDETLKFGQTHLVANNSVQNRQCNKIAAKDQNNQVKFCKPVKIKSLHCRKCGCKSDSQQDYYAHQKCHLTNQTVFKCDRCSFVSKSNSDLKRHEVCHFEQMNSVQAKGDQVDNNSESVTADGQAKRSNEVMKMKMYYCQYCRYSSRCRQLSYSHQKIHINKAKTYSCNKCPYSSTDKQRLHMHEKCHLQSKKFNCSQCSYTCNHNYNLRWHMKWHSNTFDYKCFDCDYETNYKSSIKCHLRNSGHSLVHDSNNDDKTTAQTEACIAVEETINALSEKVDKSSIECHLMDSGHSLANDSNNEDKSTAHAEGCIAVKETTNALSENLTPTELKQFKQNIEENPHPKAVANQNSDRKPLNLCYKGCSFKAYSIEELLQHIRSEHTTVKRQQYFCNRCPFIAKSKKHYEYHLQNHIGSKPFKCDQRDNNCINKTMLQSHEKIHLIINELRCQRCDNETNKNSSLKHQLTESGHSLGEGSNGIGKRNAEAEECIAIEAKTNALLGSVNESLIEHQLRDSGHSLMNGSNDVDNRTAGVEESGAVEMIKNALSEKVTDTAFKEVKQNIQERSTRKAAAIQTDRNLRNLCSKDCSSKATSNEKLWQHIRSIHPTYSQQLICNICPFITHCRKHYENHLRIHIRSKLFKCDECEYRTRFLTMFKRHRKRTGHTVVSETKLYAISKTKDEIVEPEKEKDSKTKQHEKVLDCESGQQSTECCPTVNDKNIRQQVIDQNNRSCSESDASHESEVIHEQAMDLFMSCSNAEASHEPETSHESEQPNKDTDACQTGPLFSKSEKVDLQQPIMTPVSCRKPPGTKIDSILNALWSKTRTPNETRKIL